MFLLIENLTFSCLYIYILSTNVIYHQFETYHPFEKETPQFDLTDVMNDGANHHVIKKSE